MDIDYLFAEQTYKMCSKKKGDFDWMTSSHLELKNELQKTIDVVEQNIVDISKDLLNVLLQDKTTGKNIVWATDNYRQYGEAYLPNREIKPELITGNNTDIIQPRASKSLSEQLKRTREKAEVFTPSWVCNKQNNQIDDVWFGKKEVFNTIDGARWNAHNEKIDFSNGKKWQDYVDAKRLEISCGEAPYLVSRYDTVSGMQIAIKNRIGLLDRKLRIVNENTNNRDEWLTWALRAFQSVYGFEYQGDNLLLARENILLTFIEYYEDRFGEKPDLEQILMIANIVSWNIWQMDGISMTAPYSEVPSSSQQMDLSSELFGEAENHSTQAANSKIFDWQANKSIDFCSIRNRGI